MTPSETQEGPGGESEKYRPLSCTMARPGKKSGYKGGGSGELSNFGKPRTRHRIEEEEEEATGFTASSYTRFLPTSREGREQNSRCKRGWERQEWGWSAKPPINSLRVKLNELGDPEEERKTTGVYYLCIWEETIKRGNVGLTRRKRGRLLLGVLA